MDLFILDLFQLQFIPISGRGTLFSYVLLFKCPLDLGQKGQLVP
jgi:hypothetical protein